VVTFVSRLHEVGVPVQAVAQVQPLSAWQVVCVVSKVHEVGKPVQLVPPSGHVQPAAVQVSWSK
jgi:hypothetical protein